MQPRFACDAINQFFATARARGKRLTIEGHGVTGAGVNFDGLPEHIPRSLPLYHFQCSQSGASAVQCDFIGDHYVKRSVVLEPTSFGISPGGTRVWIHDEHTLNDLNIDVR